MTNTFPTTIFGAREADAANTIRAAQAVDDDASVIAETAVDIDVHEPDEEAEA
jgi:hypothetical protein